MATYLSVYTSEIRSNNEQSEQQSDYLEDRILSAHPSSHMLCISCSRNTCTAGSWLGVEESSYYCAELKLTKINHNLLSNPFPL